MEFGSNGFPKRASIEKELQAAFRQQDFKRFDAFLTLLRSYFKNSPGEDASTESFSVCGLLLIRLLSVGDLSSFRVCEEMLSKECVSSPIVSLAISLERLVAAGGISRLRTEAHVPAAMAKQFPLVAEMCEFFLKKLVSDLDARKASDGASGFEAHTKGARFLRSGWESENGGANADRKSASSSEVGMRLAYLLEDVA